MNITEKLDQIFVPMGAFLLAVLVPLAIAGMVLSWMEKRRK